MWQCFGITLAFAREGRFSATATLSGLFLALIPLSTVIQKVTRRAYSKIEMAGEMRKYLYVLYFKSLSIASIVSGFKSCRS